MTASRVRVIRDNAEKVVPSEELVPGDYVVLSEGDLVTADIRLSESASLTVDESSLTGESIPVVKDHDAVVAPGAQPYDYRNSLLSGTTVVRGQGKGYVVRTGRGTYFARIAGFAKNATQTARSHKPSAIFRSVISRSLLLFS